MHTLSETEFDIGLIQKTWLNPDDATIISEIKDYVYNVIEKHRTKRNTGGGVVFIYKENVQLNKHHHLTQYKSFEYFCSELNSGNDLLALLSIYRPPYSKNHRITQRTFLDDSESLLRKYAMKNNVNVTSTFTPKIQKMTTMLQIYPLSLKNMDYINSLKARPMTMVVLLT